MTPLGKQITTGMAQSTLGAFIWAVIFSLIHLLRGSATWSDVAWFPPIGVLYSSWFVLPFGILLGAALPCLARRCSTICAIVCSGLLGAAVGALAAYLTARFVWRAAFQEYAVTMIPFCSVWLAGWAWRLNWKQNEGLTFG
jgi:hypothetical protein